MAEKLIRDLIPAYMYVKGESVKVRVVNNAVERRDLLADKVVEEALEVQEAVKTGKSYSDIKEEMGDLLEALSALREHLHLSPESVESVRDKKRETKGGFTKGFALAIE